MINHITNLTKNSIFFDFPKKKKFQNTKLPYSTHLTHLPIHQINPTNSKKKTKEEEEEEEGAANRVLDLLPSLPTTRDINVAPSLVNAPIKIPVNPQDSDGHGRRRRKPKRRAGLKEGPRGLFNLVELLRKAEVWYREERRGGGGRSVLPRGLCPRTVKFKSR